MGNVLCIFRLCSWNLDITKELTSFFEAILVWGYQAATIKPIFEKAITNAKTYIKIQSSITNKKICKKISYPQSTASSSKSLFTQTTLPHKSFKTFGIQKFTIQQVNCHSQTHQLEGQNHLYQPNGYCIQPSPKPWQSPVSSKN